MKLAPTAVSYHEVGFKRVNRTRKKIYWTFAAICLVFACTPIGLALLVRLPLPSFLARPIGFYYLIATNTENRMRDALARVGRKAKIDPQLVYLAIDNASIKLDQFSYDEIRNSPEFAMMSQGWPWSRQVHAWILDRLFAWDAKLVIIDLLFLVQTPHDAVLEDALRRYSDRVIVGANFVKSYQTMGGTRQMVVSLDIPTTSLIPRFETLDPRIAFVNFYPDIDGVIRYADYFESFNAVENKAEDGVYTQHVPSLAAAALKYIGEADRLDIKKSARRIRFGGPMGSYPPISVAQFFDPKNTASLFQNGAFFKDKIVILGPYGNWSQDEHLTPMGLMPGPEIHLHAIAAARQGEWIKETGPAMNITMILCAGILAFVFNSVLKRISLRLLAIIGALALFTAATALFFNYANLYLLWFTPSAVFFFSCTACLSYEFMVEQLEKQKMRSTLGRYVSENIVSQILDQEDAYQTALGGVRRPVAVLFSDIRGFTSLAEKANSHALVAQLNEYLTEMVECVFAHGGTLDKFIGDAVMAVWGNAVSRGPRENALNAVRCAWLMQERLVYLNAKWKKEKKPQLVIGIGVNYGEAVVGNMGSPRRMEFTVIGDVVNLASRLEDLTRSYKYGILAGESIAKWIQDVFILKEVGEVEIRGKEKPVRVFAVIGLKSECS